MELENCANSSASSISELKAQGYVEAIEIYRALEMRYFGQNYELEVFFPGNDFDDQRVRDLWRRFHEEHNSTLTVLAVSAPAAYALSRFRIPFGSPLSVILSFGQNGAPGNRGAPTIPHLS